MLVCLACPKQASLASNLHAEEPHHHAGAGKPGTALSPSREHMKSFTTQLKDIVMKFSTGAYRHCRPCIATGVRGQGADEDNHNLYGEDDAKSSVNMGSISEDQGSSDHGLHRKLIHEDDKDSTRTLDFGGSASPVSCSRYSLLPISKSKRRHSRKKKRSSSRSTLTLKQLPSHPDSHDAIEELLNAHFQREERILAEENCHISRDEDRETRADHQLLEEAQLVMISRENHMQEHVEDGDVHVKRSKRHARVESAGNMEEWVAQVEPGVMITFVALSDGTNHLKRIRFSRELFSKWQAQLWWAENSDMVRELYSVSRTEAPFKSRSSARSSSARTSTTTSSLHQHSSQNTPVLQEREGYCQNSPSNTPMTLTMLEIKQSSSPTPSSSCLVQPSTSKSDLLSHEMMDHHDNPLYDNPEFELCYNDGVRDTLVPRDLWFSTLEEHLRRSQGSDNDFLGNDTASSTGELVRELKRVKFI